MGDIADAMLDGLLCQCCGEYIGSSCGYPRKCAGCETEKPAEPYKPRWKRRKKKDSTNA